MPAGTAAFLGLLSPVVAIALGWAVTGEDLGPWQMVGMAVVLASVAFGVHQKGGVHGAGNVRARRPDADASTRA
ncbi:EamA family transporter [Arthrobacter sp. lap29]|uniref:EamA family transporter n=1 Tax=Arthrobacter sp. lap29 TaxID=3056122 RepID=UPI0037C18548